VLCTGTLRDEEGGEAAVLGAALEARGSAAVLPLARLDPAAMARMAAACVGAAGTGAAPPSRRPSRQRPGRARRIGHDPRAVRYMPPR
jgi:hypothetical protein